MAEKAVLLNSGSSFGTFDVVHVPGDSHSFDATCAHISSKQLPAVLTPNPRFGKSKDAAYAVSTSAKSVVIVRLQRASLLWRCCSRAHLWQAHTPTAALAGERASRPDHPRRLSAGTAAQRP